MALTSAPCSNKSLTTDSCPYQQARCNGVSENYGRTNTKWWSIPRWWEGIYWRPILHHLCHTTPSHLSKQVSERKIEGHELETVLLTNFLFVSKNIRILFHHHIYEPIFTIFSATFRDLWQLSSMYQINFLHYSWHVQLFITHNWTILFHKAHLQKSIRFILTCEKKPTQPIKMAYSCSRVEV